MSESPHGRKVLRAVARGLRPQRRQATADGRHYFQAFFGGPGQLLADERNPGRQLRGDECVAVWLDERGPAYPQRRPPANSGELTQVIALQSIGGSGRRRCRWS